ncbi:MAG: sensor histidine kinase [Bacteroidota bacterium]
MKSALKITLIYTLIGVLWIVLSDKVAYYLFSDFEIYTQNLFQIIKGIFYVLMTAFILYTLIHSYNRKIDEKVEELKSLNKTLEFERDKLKQSNEQLEQFAAVASHDLKSPLRTISSLIQRFKKKFSDQINPQNKEYLDIIERSTQKLFTKIDKTLLFSKISHSKNPRETVDTKKIITEVESNLRKSIEETEASIHCEHLPKVQGDRTMLYQVFQNIIENSLKYRKTDTPPVIRIQTESLKDTIQFSILDNGIGIAQKDLEKVFKQYQQINQDQFFSGQGIGLAAIKKIIERLNGTIWMTSEEGEGTTVHFTLPKAQ